jgi:hypothetical protein
LLARKILKINKATLKLLLSDVETVGGLGIKFPISGGREGFDSSTSGILYRIQSPAGGIYRH